MKVFELHNKVKQQLKDANIESFEFEAGVIIEHIFEMDRNQALLSKDAITNSKKQELAQDVVKKRIQGYPLQYIIGKWEFYGLPFTVGPGVLIPRPDTEVICAKAIEIIGDKEFTVVDLCSGSGCIAITIKKHCKNAKVYGIEKSKMAVGYLEQNIKLNQVDVECITKDVLNEDVIRSFERLDMIVCNPPYLTYDDMQKLQKEVCFEPKEALYASQDGLRFYRKISKLWRKTLLPDGIMMFEVGRRQNKQVSEILTQQGYGDIQYVRDLRGIARVVCAKREQISK